MLSLEREVEAGEETVAALIGAAVRCFDHVECRELYVPGEAGTAIETNYGKQSSFAFSIGPGFLVPAGDKNSVDISFRYEDWANQLRQTAIRVAYRFGL